MICPVCFAEYRDGFTRCAKCEVDLVDEAAVAQARLAKTAPREALADVETVVIAQAGLPACRELETALLAGGVPAFVEAVHEEGEALSAGTVKYGVVVAQADVAKCGEVLRGRFEALVAREGIGSFSSEAVNLDDAEVTCPACQHKGALVAGECAECGLTLGVPDG